jgi:hypothetical protein
LFFHHFRLRLHLSILRCHVFNLITKNSSVHNTNFEFGRLLIPYKFKTASNKAYTIVIFLTNHEKNSSIGTVRKLQFLQGF